MSIACLPSAFSFMIVSCNVLVFQEVSSRQVGRYFPLGLMCGRARERFGASVNEEEEGREEEEEGGDLAT